MAAFRMIADGINTPEWDPKRQDRVRTDSARAAARLAIDGYTELALARRPAGKWVLIAFLASLLGLSVAAVLILQRESAALVGRGFIMLGVSTALGNVPANLLEKWLVSKRRTQAASEQDATDV